MHSSHFGQPVKLVPIIYPNKVVEKFLLLRMTYQGNIKTAIINILYNPIKPGKGMHIPLSLVNCPLYF